MKIKEYSMDFNGEKLVVEISDLADQANGSVLVKYGGTSVFASAVMSKHTKDGLDYFPLSVNYEEKFYAAGRILGSRFMRREGRPSDEAVLTGRLIDRTIRPLFNKKIRNEVQIAILPLSIDTKNDTDIPAIIAASLSIAISDIPWDGPVGAVRIGYEEENDTYHVNPDYEIRDKCSFDAVICGKDKKINMIEAEAKEAPEEIINKSFEKAIIEIEKIIDFQDGIIKKIGKEKIIPDIKKDPDGIEKLFNKEILEQLKDLLYSSRDKSELNEIKSHWIKIFKEQYDEEYILNADDFYEDKINEIIHSEVLENEKRPDGRKMDELRDLYAGVGAIPMIHGSGIFFRGGTHILSAVTLGGPKDSQIIEGMEVQEIKHFMHHYNFPPFSTGETGRMGTPGRREIGHGALAERALSAVIPDREIFPYTIRIVSESMASNGSTSQGSVCASTLALMDAGVPIKNPVAGIAIGLMMKDDKNYKVLTDIQGPEDHHGDMDFKCAGTKEGVTAIQMDVKVDGIPVEILGKVLKQAKKAREEILEVILKTIPEFRKELSEYAPKIIKIEINPDKIKDVIGPGGKMINSIIDKTGAEINIEQTGEVFITGRNNNEAEEAKKIVESIVKEFKAGEFAEGPVTRLFEFGAMVKIGPTQEGLVHISELAMQRVEKVTDIVKEGDTIKVKVIGIDEKGRVNLSLKQADPNYDSSKDIRKGNGSSGSYRNDRNDRNDRGGRNSNFKRR